MGRHSKSEERRGQILKAAASLFVEHGYPNTSVRDIAAKCDMRVSNLYHYIGSKHNILGMFQEYTTYHLKNFMTENQSIINSMDPVEAMRYALKQYIEWVNEYQDVAIFWYQESKHLSPEQLAKLAEQELYCVDVFQEVLARGVAAGVFHISDLRLAAHNIVVLCDMWAFRRWLIRKEYTFDQFVRQQTELILDRIHYTKT
ncbi:MAG: TetR family transcriptional regulator [Dehalococcoidia bacterium]